MRSSAYKPETNGVLTIYSNVALTKEKERRRNGERVFTSFLLQFLGESRGILQTDPKRSQYLDRRHHRDGGELSTPFHR